MRKLSAAKSKGQGAACYKVLAKIAHQDELEQGSLVHLQSRTHDCIETSVIH